MSRGGRTDSALPVWRRRRFDRPFAWLLAAWLAAAAPWSHAEEEGLEISIVGVEGEIADNVRSYVAGDFTAVTRTTSNRARAQYVLRAQDQAVIALRPFGHYRATATADFEPIESGWRLNIQVDAGPPVIVESVDLELTGPGASHRELVRWRQSWPLEEGAVLDQRTWEAQKAELLETAANWGFLEAELKTSRIDLDLELEGYNDDSEYDYRALEREFSGLESEK